MVLEGASTLGSVDVSALREGQHACKTVEAGEALQMFDTRCGKFFHSFSNIDTTLDAIYFSMRAGFPKFRLAPRCLAPCFYRLMRDFHCDKATLRSSANCS